MAERISGHTELIGLIATPIRHSKSPKMHNEAFAKLGLDYAYLAFEVGNEELEDAVKGFKALKVRGYNVSMPNKTVIGQYLDHLSPAAELCGAVNTVVNDNGVLTGHMTDGIGYRRSLKDAGIEPAGKNVKNINEKTSCKATLFDLADTEAFKREIEDSYLFANATGVGMKPLEGQMVIPDASFLRKDLIVTDVVYMPTETELLRVAKEVGCKTMNGLGMMLYQGAAAFELWTGKEMPIDYMKEILDIKF